MSLTQENRLLTIDTPLGEDVLVLTGFSGTEGISKPFSFALTLASEDSAISLPDIIGRNVTVGIALADDEKRYINGFISRFSQEREGHVEGDETQRITTYSAQLVPWVWYLSRCVNFRIFQNRSVPQIVEQIFGELDFSDYELRLRESYEPRENCVQYRETDLAFISRLMEQDGIFYFFEHEQGRHLMVITDSAEEFHDCPHQETARCQPSGGSTVHEEDMIGSLVWGQEIRFGKYTSKDYNFLMPSADLKVETPTRIALGPGVRELYDFPGDYQTRSQGDRYANLRMQAEEARVTAIRGTGNCRAFTSGYRFTLQDYYRDDMNGRPYVITEVSHGADQAVGGSGEHSEGTYTNRFTCIPSDVPFRPQQATAKPVVVGVQTAVVTGPEGEEIYTDEHGRVKVKFHWDRDPGRDDKSSCWVRVAQMWAGQGWGSMWIPRIGHEVVVSFVEGDPDRPIITGSVYHASNVPPYPLPEDKTRSTIKSNSTKGGGGYNELRFEDLKGKEEIWIHGQKDWNILIENDKNQTIGVNETKRVGVNETVTIGANRTVTVGLNKKETVAENKAETVGMAKELTIGGLYQVTVGAAMNETVGAVKGEEIGKDKIVVVGAKSTETIGQDKKVDVGGHLTENADKNVNIDAGKQMGLSSGADMVLRCGKKFTLEVEDQITIKCGDASITFKKNGDISIEGKKLNLKASGNITMKGSKILGN